jgi:hypothetical protein
MWRVYSKSLNVSRDLLSGRPGADQQDLVPSYVPKILGV